MFKAAWLGGKSNEEIAINQVSGYFAGKGEVDSVWEGLQGKTLEKLIYQLPMNCQLQTHPSARAGPTEFP